MSKKWHLVKVKVPDFLPCRRQHSLLNDSYIKHVLTIHNEKINYKDVGSHQFTRNYQN